MKITDWFKQDIDTPSKQEVIYLLMLIILPNVLFLVLAFYTETARPLINLDYIISLFFILLPCRLIKITGTILLSLAMLFDNLMFIIQIFPFMNLSAIAYLSSFLWDAPIKYIFGFIFLVLMICAIIFSSNYLSRKIKQPYPSFILIIVLILGYMLMTLGISYTRFYGILGRDNYYISHSQSKLYLEITQSDFSDLMNTKPELKLLTDQDNHATKDLKQPYSSKILLILAESWGEFRNPDAQKMIVQNIFEQKNNLEQLSLDSFHTIGATVAGELRELCGLRLANNGFALSHTDASQFSDCLPNHLKQNGYQTIALHATSGLLYDRTDWYRRAGFQKTRFGEHFLNLSRCTPFKGVCDGALMSFVAQTFEDHSKKKLFFYWMTLTSHQPYSSKDIYNHRFECEKFNMNPNGDACNNARLQTQFFDDLAELIQKPEMQGVEVIVVGDHQPPIWGEDIKYIRPLTVGYLHFKVKENIND